MKYYKLLEKLTHLDRNLSPQETARREADKGRFKPFVAPRKAVVKFAKQDGKAARDLAVAKLEKRDYDGAQTLVDDAEVCFAWADEPGALNALQQLRRTIEVSRHSNRGDQYLESVAAALKPVYAKDTRELEQTLGAADEAFDQAKDEAGREVVARMTRCLGNVREVDSRWARLQVALHAKDYDKSVRQLERVRHFLRASREGLAFVNATLDTVATVVCNPVYSAHGMVADLALLDAAKAAERAEQAAGGGQLDEAAALAKGAQQCYTWVATSMERPEREMNGMGGGGGGNGTDNGSMLSMGSGLGTMEEGDEERFLEDEDAIDNGSLRSGNNHNNNNKNAGGGGGGGSSSSAAWSVGASTQDSRATEKLLQRFIRHFPCVNGPRIPLESQAASRVAEARDALRRLSQVQRSVASQQALRRGRERVRAFRDGEPFSSRTADEKLERLREALAVFEKHGFAAEAEQVTHLAACRRGDRCLEEIPGTHQPQAFFSAMEASLEVAISKAAAEKSKKDAGSKKNHAVSAADKNAGRGAVAAAVAASAAATAAESAQLAGGGGGARRGGRGRGAGVGDREGDGEGEGAQGLVQHHRGW